MIDSIKFRIRKITKTRGSFRTDKSAMRLIYLALRDISQQRSSESASCTHGWTALNRSSCSSPIESRSDPSNEHDHRGSQH